MPLHDVSGVSTGPGQFLAQQQPSGAASVSFSGLPFTEFSMIKVSWFLQTSNAADQLLQLQINGDSTSGHYGYATTDRTAGNSDSSSATAADVGWVCAGSQVRGMGEFMFPSGFGGSTRAGMSHWGGGTGAGGVRMGYGTFFFSFNISGTVSSFLVQAAAGNLTGTIDVWGLY